MKDSNLATRRCVRRKIGDGIEMKERWGGVKGMRN